MFKENQEINKDFFYKKMKILSLFFHLFIKMKYLNKRKKNGSASEKLKHNLSILIILILLINPTKSHEPDLYAILISTSKYWFNYRQSANIMLIYHKLKEYGLQDKNVYILLIY